MLTAALGHGPTAILRPAAPTPVPAPLGAAVDTVNIATTVLPLRTRPVVAVGQALSNPSVRIPREALRAKIALVATVQGTELGIAVISTSVPVRALIIVTPMPTVSTLPEVSGANANQATREMV